MKNLLPELLRQQLRERGLRIATTHIPEGWQPQGELLELYMWWLSVQYPEGKMEVV